MRQKLLTTLITALLLTINSLNGRAATMCATNSSELQSILNTAAVNGEDDEVRIATGNYPSPTGGFMYNPVGLVNGDDKSLSVSGGWTEFIGNPCGQQLSQDPTLTVINGGGSNRGLVMFIRETGNVSIDLLTFINGYASGFSRGGGLQIRPAKPYNGAIRVENNHFIANEGYSDGALEISFEHGPVAQLVISNNLFAGNHARELVGTVTAIVNQPAAADATRGNPTPDPAISFTNNTVVNNTTGDTDEDAVGGIWIFGTVETKWIANNNLWANDGADIGVHSMSASGFRLWNNNIQTRIGVEPEFVENNISVVPTYKNCGLFCVHREPTLDSPLVDAGVQPLATYPWELTATDAAGRARITGPAVDIGAYENHSRLFQDRFEQ